MARIARVIVPSEPHHVTQREGWRGHLWQGRFGSFVLDEAHRWTAGRYIELNPVRAHLAAHPADWPWSSARAHLGVAEASILGSAGALRERFGDWHGYLAAALSLEELETFRRHTRTGRPLGGEAFLERLERQLSRPIKKRKAGRKPHPRPIDPPEQGDFLNAEE